MIPSLRHALSETFLTNVDGGVKGPQETVPKPGSYRLNQYLFRVNVSDKTRATIIPAGSVGMVKSNALEAQYGVCRRQVAAAAQETAHPRRSLVPLVPKGRIGIWSSRCSPAPTISTAEPTT